MVLRRIALIGALVVLGGVALLTVIDHWFVLDVVNAIGANASARAGGSYDIGSPEDIRRLSVLAKGGHNPHVRVVVKDDYAVTVAFYDDADASLYKRSGGGWQKVSEGVLPDACALVKLGVPWFTAGKLESAVYASEESPPHHDPCAH